MQRDSSHRPPRASEPVPVSDLPPRTAAADPAADVLAKHDDDDLPIEDLPPRRNVTGG